MARKIDPFAVLSFMASLAAVAIIWAGATIIIVGVYRWLI